MFIRDIILLVSSLIAVFIGSALMSGKTPEFRFLNVFEKYKNKELGFAFILLSLFGLGYSLYAEGSSHPVIIVVGALSWVFLFILGLSRPIHHHVLRIAEIMLAALFIIWMALLDHRLIWADLVLLAALAFWILVLTRQSLKNKSE